MKKDLFKLAILQSGVQHAMDFSKRFDFDSIEDRGHRFYAQDCLQILHDIPVFLDAIEKIITEQKLDPRDIGKIAHDFQKIEERAAYLPANPDNLHIDILVLKRYLENILSVIKEIDLVNFVFETCKKMR